MHQNNYIKLIKGLLKNGYEFSSFEDYGINLAKNKDVPFITNAIIIKIGIK